MEKTDTRRCIKRGRYYGRTPPVSSFHTGHGKIKAGYCRHYDKDPIRKAEASERYRYFPAEEEFRLNKQYNDAHVTRSKVTKLLEARFFCQFVVYGYEPFSKKTE